MYKILQYYLCKNEIKEHIVTIKDTEQEINDFKENLVNWLNKNNTETYEVVATKNVNSIKKVLTNENTFYFKVVND